MSIFLDIGEKREKCDCVEIKLAQQKFFINNIYFV